MVIHKSSKNRQTEAKLSLEADFLIYYELLSFPLNRLDLRRFLSAGLNPAILDMRQRYRVSSRGIGGEAG